MSDDECCHHEYDYLEWDEEPFNAVDDMAEHTMHSPVWISYRPGFDWVDGDTDIDQSADEYYDNISSMSGKRKSSRMHQQGPSLKKRRKVESIQQIPDLILDSTPTLAQPVVWKPLSQRIKSPELPVLKDGEAKKVTLMKDWRKQIEAVAENRKFVKHPSESKKRPRNSNEHPLKAGAFQECALEEEEGIASPPLLPPLSLVEQPLAPEPKKHASAHTNRASSTIARQAMRQASVAVAQHIPPSEGNGESTVVEEMDTKATKGGMESKRRGKTGRGKGEAGDSTEKSNGGSNLGKKRKAEDNMEEPPQKKPALGRNRKVNDTTKYGQASTSTGRMTRSRTK